MLWHCSLVSFPDDFSHAGGGGGGGGGEIRLVIRLSVFHFGSGAPECWRIACDVHSTARRALNMDVDRAIDAACLRLGYSSLRKDQEEAVKNFASVLNMD